MTEHHSAIRGNELLIHAMMWMNLEYNIFEGKGQDTKDHLVHQLHLLAHKNFEQGEKRVHGDSNLKYGCLEQGWAAGTDQRGACKNSLGYWKCSTLYCRGGHLGT